MEISFLNEVNGKARINLVIFMSFLTVLAPMVPHFSSELFELILGKQLEHAVWPEVDESLAAVDEIEIAVQINGKLRGDVKVPADASKEQIEALALQSEPASKVLNGGAPKKVIVVPGRLVNVVA